MRDHLELLSDADRQAYADALARELMRPVPPYAWPARRVDSDRLPVAQSDNATVLLRRMRAERAAAYEAGYKAAQRDAKAAQGQRRRSRTTTGRTGATVTPIKPVEAPLVSPAHPSVSSGKRRVVDVEAARRRAGEGL